MINGLGIQVPLLATWKQSLFLIRKSAFAFLPDSGNGSLTKPFQFCQCHAEGVHFSSKGTKTHLREACYYRSKTIYYAAVGPWHEACSTAEGSGASYVYEKDRYSDKVIDPRGSGQHLKDFKTDSAPNDSAKADPGLQSRRSMAHPRKSLSGMGPRRRKRSA